MSTLTHDDTVTVQSFEDHLGFPLNAFDEIKLEDVIIAWCSQSGEAPNSALYSLCLHRLDNAAR